MLKSIISLGPDALAVFAVVYALFVFPVFAVVVGLFFFVDMVPPAQLSGVIVSLPVLFLFVVAFAPDSSANFFACCVL